MPATATVRFPPFASTKCTTKPVPKCASTRTTTPPSGVAVRPESRRTRFNHGAIRFRQLTESASLFESVSIWMKGGWKETRGVQRPISGHRPVSESRLASLNPFETKRKRPHQEPHLGFALCKWRGKRDSNSRDAFGYSPEAALCKPRSKTHTPRTSRREQIASVRGDGKECRGPWAQTKLPNEFTEDLSNKGVSDAQGG